MCVRVVLGVTVTLFLGLEQRPFSASARKRFVWSHFFFSDFVDFLLSSILCVCVSVYFVLEIYLLSGCAVKNHNAMGRLYHFIDRIFDSHLKVQYL